MSRFRIYDPATATFISRDRLPYMNKYRCFSNDPVRQVDRDGLGSIDTHYYVNGTEVETFNAFTFNDYMNATTTLWYRQQPLTDGRPSVDAYPLPGHPPSVSGQDWGGITLGTHEYQEIHNCGANDIRVAGARSMVKEALTKTLEDSTGLEDRLAKIAGYKGPCEKAKTKRLLECMLNKLDRLHITCRPFMDRNAFGQLPPNVTYGLAPRRPSFDIVLFNNVFVRQGGESDKDILSRVAGTIAHELSHTCGTNDPENAGEPQFSGIPFGPNVPFVIGLTGRR